MYLDYVHHVNMLHGIVDTDFCSDVLYLLAFDRTLCHVFIVLYVPSAVLLRCVFYTFLYVGEQKTYTGMCGLMSQLTAC